MSRQVCRGPFTVLEPPPPTCHFCLQAIGVVSNAALLTQLYLAGYMPPLSFWPLLCTTLAALGLVVARARLPRQVLDAFSAAAGLMGLAVVPQVLLWTVAPDAPIFPGLVALLLGLWALWKDSRGQLGGWCKSLWDRASGCTATALFAMQPVAQLARNFSDPFSLSGISIASVCLGLLGNALMVPRAALVGDFIWLFGATWGCVLMGWGQLLSLKIGEYDGAGGTPSRGEVRPRQGGLSRGQTVSLVQVPPRSGSSSSLTTSSG